MTSVTWNPSDANNDCVLANGNLDASSTNAAASRGCRATQGYATGAFYFEVKRTTLGTADNMIVGIADNTTAYAQSGNTSFYPGAFANSIGTRRDFQASTGFTEDVPTAFGGSDTLNDVYMFAVDITNKKIWRGLNGTWLGSVTPVVNASTQWGHWTGAYTVFPAIGNMASTTPVGHIQPRAATFSFAAPSGFSAWEAPASTVAFRRSLSPVGTRAGSRQAHVM